jgi:hypothetical protein
MSKESKKVSGSRKEAELILIFRRTGERRYGIEAKRDSFPDLQMNPAAGYNPLMPHDLMHLVVEAQLGLTRGIFGQLAAGGTAGTFHSIFDPKIRKRTAARIRNRIKARGKKLLSVGRDECVESERATFICWQEWLARSKAKDRQTTAKNMSAQAKQVRGTSSATELRVLDERKMNEICQHLDQLSSEWSKLEVGQSIAVRWPDLAVSSNADSLQQPTN